MIDNSLLPYIQEVLNNKPAGWLSTTTHRLDIYEENEPKRNFNLLIQPKQFNYCSFI
jgi:hypothetical protein